MSEFLTTSVTIAYTKPGEKKSTINGNHPIDGSPISFPISNKGLKVPEELHTGQIRIEQRQDGTINYALLLPPRRSDISNF